MSCPESSRQDNEHHLSQLSTASNIVERVSSEEEKLLRDSQEGGRWEEEGAAVRGRSHSHMLRCHYGELRDLP